jgi:hypothetical protein
MAQSQAHVPIRIDQPNNGGSSNRLSGTDDREGNNASGVASITQRLRALTADPRPRKSAKQTLVAIDMATTPHQTCTS